MRTYSLYSSVAADTYPGAFVTIANRGILRVVAIGLLMDSLLDNAGGIVGVTSQPITSLETSDVRDVLAWVGVWNNTQAASTGAHNSSIALSIPGLNHRVEPGDRFYLPFDVPSAAVSSLRGYGILYIDEG